MGFDIEAAKKAGYSESEINAYLSSQSAAPPSTTTQTPPIVNAPAPSSAPASSPSLMPSSVAVAPESMATTENVNANLKALSDTALQSALPVAGGLTGAALGTLTAPVTGPVGPIAGEMIGAGAGEWLNQKLGITEPSKSQIAIVAAAPGVMRALGPTMKFALKRLPGASEVLHETGATDARALASRVRTVGDPSALFADAAESGGKIDTAGLRAAIAPLYYSESKLAGKNAKLALYLKRLDARLANQRYMDPLDFHEEMSRAGQLAYAASKNEPAGWGKYKAVHAAFWRTLDRAEETIDQWVMNEGQVASRGAVPGAPATSMPTPGVGGVPAKTGGALVPEGAPLPPGPAQITAPGAKTLPGGQATLPGAVEGEVIPPGGPSPTSTPAGARPEFEMGRTTRTSPLESAVLLKKAILASRRNFAEESLGDYIEHGITTIKGSRTLSGRGDVTEVNAKAMIDAFVADTNMQKVFKPDEIADIKATLKKLNQLPSINKEDPIIRHGKRALIGGVIGGVATRTPMGAATGSAIAAFGPDIIAKAVTTAPGRKALNGLLDVTAGHLGKAELGALATFLASQTGAKKPQ